MSFRMQLASLSGDAAAYVPLSFSNAGDASGAAPRAPNPVLARTVGSQLECGHLFAYLFRRFGYPNLAWDGRAQLCRYLLTTPRKDLLLSVVPQTDGSAERSLEFLGPLAVARAARSHLGESQYEWECRALAYRAARGMPRWLHARVRASARAKTGRVDDALAERPGDVHQGRAWRESLRIEPADAEATALRLQRFLQCCRDVYAAIEQPPQPQARPLDPRDWAESDPLKSYALAAITTLRDLMRDVKLGNGAIDVFGTRPVSSRAVDAAPTAGAMCGALLNLDAELHAELASRLAGLGQGDARQGLRRALALLPSGDAH